MSRIARPKQPRRAVAIVGDGQTERIYFSDVRDTDRPQNLSIFPDYPRKIGSYQGVLDRAIELAEDYDKVYALIDLDKVISDNQFASYTKAKATAQSKGIIVLENNPCFEMWLLVHFTNTGQLFNSCSEVSKLLKSPDRLPNYNKSEKFLRNARLYNSCKLRISQYAIANAKLLEKDRAQKDPLFPRAETFRFFEWYLAQENGSK
jgi:hypothetical protein